MIDGDSDCGTDGDNGDGIQMILRQCPLLFNYRLILLMY